MKTEMNNTGFTKGPWKAGKHNEIRSINGTMVAIVLEHVPDIMIKANAKLIAAAPELLQCVIDLMEHPLGDPEHPQIWLNAQEVVQRVISCPA